jgi:hypothetical protein
VPGARVARCGTRVEVFQVANDRFFAEMMRKRHRQIFWQDSCSLANSYYFDKNGDVPLRPTSTHEAVWRSRRFRSRTTSSALSSELHAAGSVRNDTE